MNQPTKEEWEQVVKDLDSLFKPVHLLCDGFYVRYSMVRHKNKLVIDVYVNGKLKGEWFTLGDEFPEEIRRFFRLRVMNRYKDIKKWEKILGKREAKKQGIYEKVTFPSCYWNRPRPLIRHLIKHNKDIQIIDSKTHEEAVSSMNHE